MPDREKVIEALEICAAGTNSCNKCPMKELCKGVSNAAMVAAIKLLKEQEAIVRCRDCKYLNAPANGVPFCKRIKKFVDADWFCADGERE